MVLTGTLHSVDQYLNVNLMSVKVVDENIYPQLLAPRNCFVRSSVVRLIQIQNRDVDTEILQDASRNEESPTTISSSLSKLSSHGATNSSSKKKRYGNFGKK